MTRTINFLRKNFRNLPSILTEAWCGYDFSQVHAGKENSQDFPYEKTDRDILVRALRSLPITETDSLLDIGCGKGYVLYCAYREGFFHCVAGIEKNSRLSSICRLNLSKAKVPATVYEQDASNFSDYDDFSHIYMFNPFSEQVMLCVIKLVLASLKRQPRPLTLLYANPTLHQLIMPHASSMRVVNGRISGINTCISIYNLIST